MKIAAIDLGTNTFHITIVETGLESPWKIILDKKNHVKLAAGGISSINDKSLVRAKNALTEFSRYLFQYQVSKFRVVGTAALRTANNSKVLIDHAVNLGMNIEVIDGLTEARLIYKGVVLAAGQIDRPSLIMDIGGGSVEFILCDSKQILWAESFPIGVAVLFHRFHKDDPISNNEVQLLNEFLENKLKPLREILNKIPAEHLIGASGTFDVLSSILNKKMDVFLDFPTNQFYTVYNRVVPSSINHRRQMSDIPSERVDMIVVALILIQYVLSVSQIKKIWVSAYALKEGLLQEILEN